MNTIAIELPKPLLERLQNESIPPQQVIVHALERWFAEPVSKVKAAEEKEMDAIIAELRREGVIMEPTPEMLAMAAKWDALSEQEQQRHREEMDALHLDPPLSQIIIDSRR